MQVSEQFQKVVGATLASALIIAAALFVVMCVSPPSRVGAQNSGVVGIQAQMIPIFTAQASTKSSKIFNDIGQGTNLLYVCTTGYTGTIDLEWSAAPSAASPVYNVITQASYTVDTGCHSIVFGSYFPNMRSTMTRSGGSLSAWYTASSGPGGFGNSAIGTNGPTAPINCDQNFATSVASATVGAIANPFNTGDTVVICALTISFAAAPSGTIEVRWYSSANCTTGGIANVWQSYVSSSSANPLIVPMIQRYPVPNYSACFANTSGTTAEVSVSYASVHLP